MHSSHLTKQSYHFSNSDMSVDEVYVILTNSSGTLINMVNGKFVRVHVEFMTRPRPVQMILTIKLPAEEQE